MRTDEFDYFLPAELIAQSPVLRGESRLLVLHRNTGLIEHKRFADLPTYLTLGDTLVLNDTRVSARRLRVVRRSGPPAEVLLLNPVDDSSWTALVKPGKRIHIGDELFLATGHGTSVCAR